MCQAILKFEALFLGIRVLVKRLEQEEPWFLEDIRPPREELGLNREREFVEFVTVIFPETVLAWRSDDCVLCNALLEQAARLQGHQHYMDLCVIKLM